MLIKIVTEAIKLGKQYGVPIARGLSNVEKPLFKWAYKGQPNWARNKAWNYYKASTLATIIKPGVDFYLDGLLETDVQQVETGQVGKTRSNVVKPWRKRKYSKKCPPYKYNRR